MQFRSKILGASAALAAAFALLTPGALAASGRRPGFQTVQSTPTVRATRISLSPISGAPHQVLILNSTYFEPGSGSPPHYHPGDKTVRVELGDLTFIIGDAPPKTYHEGDVVRIPAGVTHAVYNLGDEPASALEILILEKGQPISVRVASRSNTYPPPRRRPYRPTPLSDDFGQ